MGSNEELEINPLLLRIRVADAVDLKMKLHQRIQRINEHIGNCQYALLSDVTTYNGTDYFVSIDIHNLTTGL